VIKLDAPLIIHPDTYDGLFIVRCEFDLRAQTAELHLAPARSDATAIHLGVKEQVGTTIAYRFPEVVRTVTLRQNLVDPDPAITTIMTALASFLEIVEQTIVANQHEENGLATTALQIGTTEWELASTVVPNETRKVEVKELPAKPAKEKPPKAKPPIEEEPLEPPE
jgi:hypothetical protein